MSLRHDHPTSVFDEGYGLLPNKVNFSQEIPDAAKILYTYIASLTAQDGWCRAKNKHFAEKYGKSTRQISRLINILIDHNLVFPDYDDQTSERTRMTVFRLERKGVDKNVQGGRTKMSALTDANNNINKNTSSTSETSDVPPSTEVSKQLTRLYEGYLIKFKIPLDHWEYADIIEKHRLLEEAKKKYRLTPKRRAPIMRRLQDAGFLMCRKAIRGFGNDPFYRGEVPGKKWKPELEWIFKSYENIEKGDNKFDEEQEDQ